MAKILVIDDESALRETVTMALAQIGHSVTEANDGREGLKAVDFDEPDLVICDLIMSGKEGIETIITLRKEHPDLRILAMSGHKCGPTYLRFAEQLGATASLAKPFGVEELRGAVSHLLLARRH